MALKRMVQMRNMEAVDIRFLWPIVGYGMVDHERNEDTSKAETNLKMSH
jgi:hypothetical protein